MKRKRATRTLFIWGRDPVDDEDEDEDYKKPKKQRSKNAGETTSQNENPQLELLFKRGTYYKDGFFLPYEMMIKIFKDVVDISDNPITDLYSISRVCENWRQMVLTCSSLWSRIDFTKVPATKRNLGTIAKIFDLSPTTINAVREFALAGPAALKESKREVNLIGDLITAPNLKILTLKDLRQQPILPQLITRSMDQCCELQELTVTHSGDLVSNPKWLIDYLIKHGKKLQVLNLAMSLNTISFQLFRAFSSEYCPNLRFLDISTSDALNTHTFDVTALSRNLPNLEVLRMANVSFRRVLLPPEAYYMKKLRELSMPVAMRDADRDDALFATLSFGTEKMRALDLRGSTISADALLEMPSFEIRELHIDDICPIQRYKYHEFLKKWSKSLEVLSLVKINCSETLKKCLQAIGDSPIRELDLSSSDVASVDLTKYIKNAKHLSTLDLTSCRSLPRGCKGLYSRNPSDSRTQKLSSLKSKLK